MYKTVYGKIDLTRDAVFADIIQFLTDIGWTDEYTYDDSLATAFQANHAYSVGDIVCPASKNGWVYICDTAGTSASSAPSFTTTGYGQKITSGAAVFRAIPNGRVFSSRGESGSGEKFYLYLTKVMRAEYIDAMGAMYLDSTSHILRHTGQAGCNQTSTSYRVCLQTQESAQNVYLYGDKDTVVLHSRNGMTSLNGIVALRADEPLIQHKWHLTQPTVYATGNTTLTVDSTANMLVGQYLLMVHSAGNGKQTVRVVSITDSTHVVVDKTLHVMPTGSVLYDTPPVVGLYWFNNISMANNFSANSGYGGNIYSLNSYQRHDNIYADGNADDEAYRIWYQSSANDGETIGVLINGNMMSQMGPSGRVIYPVGCALYNQVSSETGNSSYCSVMIPVKGNIRANIDANWLDLYLINPYQPARLMTSATSLSVVDSTQSWTTNALVDKIVAITNGAGAGQTRRISANDATSLTVTVAWQTNPDATSTYVILDQAYRCMGKGWGMKEVIR